MIKVGFPTQGGGLVEWTQNGYVFVKDAPYPHITGENMPPEWQVYPTEVRYETDEVLDQIWKERFATFTWMFEEKLGLICAPHGADVRVTNPRNQEVIILPRWFIDEVGGAML